MNRIQRFIKYVMIDTESCEDSSTSPTTYKQFDLLNLLKTELNEMGIENVKLTDKGILYAHIKENSDDYKYHIGFIAHVDTSPDMSGKNVQPQYVKNYKGNRLCLNKELGIYLDPLHFDCLKKDIGSDLIVTDGTTLLGADDKAGVALIMDLIEYIVNHPNFKHGPISLAFTPDEEVGKGTDNFDLEEFKVDFAYTIDGGDIDVIEYENFNASSINVHIKGDNIHPGNAKGKMVNANLLAMEFNHLLREFDKPEYTQGYEGFNLLTDIQGTIEASRLDYILRNHDYLKLQNQINDFKNARDFMNKKYGNRISLDIKENYRNMYDIIKDHMEIIDLVKDRMLELGIQARIEPIRGGTDGAQLTYKGLLCPNLGNGGRNYHSKYEYLSVNEFNQMAKLLRKLVEIKNV